MDKKTMQIKNKTLVDKTHPFPAPNPAPPGDVGGCGGGSGPGYIKTKAGAKGSWIHNPGKYGGAGGRAGGVVSRTRTKYRAAHGNESDGVKRSNCSRCSKGT